jgi:signal transduction histidine kinase
MIERRGSSPNHGVDIDRTAYEEEDAIELVTKGSSDALAAKVYEDKHRLPVMYDVSLREQSKQAKAETNNISVLWHELISPLTVIKGYASTLLQLNHVISEEQKEQYLKGIDAASNRVIRLLENLRDITRLEETDSLNVQRISIFDLLRQVASEMQNQTTRHIIKLHSGPRLPLVKADPEKLELVVNNILVNATKYSPHGGDIEIDVNLVQAQTELRKKFGDTPPVKLPCFIVSIADTGVGIPEGELGHIFDKFYRVKNKLTNITPGAGLGLYICKIIIEAHDGHIWARNRLQSGSAFHFSLPVERMP